ncbi:MAG: sugar phosphate isomerase/epimerase family protein [Terriglobia bacterium]
MEIGLSTRHFTNQRLTPHMLDLIHKAGMKQFEIFAARQHLDYYDANHVGDVAQWFKDNSLTLNSVHAPLFAGFDNGRSGGLAISPSYTEKRLRIEAMDEIKRAIEIAERLPFRYLALHLGRPEDEYDLRKFDAAFTSLEHLRIFAKERGAEILLENTAGALSTPERLQQFIQYTRLEVKACFDAGHAHLTGGVSAAIEILKPFIATAHLHDNRKEQDEHLMPFEGTIDWPATIGALRALPGPPIALIELHDRGPGLDGLGQIEEVIRKLNAL